ncbi:zinc-binding dehydrogenase [Pseudomonas putida]|uniref:zinc-binding dehydrogenase n=1 Tax=Pseudomonas putida TaxID=303 RepID=UPI00274D0B7F|nr:zinc-binding dehydrogenase [Pseudomonas putida]MDP9524321.1 zinc-binding dehydrogenase [Pseudomonas putida]
MHNGSLSSLPAHHRAWRWQGSAEPLELALEHVPLQPPSAGEVLVRNAVIGLNPVDWKVLGGGLVDWQPGHVPGVDGAGEVVAVGEGMHAEWLGRRVAYHTSLHGHGSFAEYAPVAARALLRMPDRLDFEVAASIPCPALTAWLAIEKVSVQPEEQPLLVSGAGGAVGHYLVQLASARGFAVSAMAHARHHERLRALGAAECLAGPLADDHAWDGGRRFHAVIDTVSGSHAERMAEALRANGHLVCIQDRLPGWPCPPFGLTLSMHEVALGALHVYGDDTAWQHLTSAGERMLDEIAEGHLQAEARVLRSFDELAQLLEDLRHRNFSGKALVQIR